MATKNKEFKVGDIVTFGIGGPRCVIDTYHSDAEIKLRFIGTTQFAHTYAGEIHHVDKTIEDVEKGDKLILGNSKCDVVERCGDIVFCMYGNSIILRTVKQLSEFGYKLFESEPKELTVKKVGELLGYKVKIVE